MTSPAAPRAVSGALGPLQSPPIEVSNVHVLVFCDMRIDRKGSNTRVRYAQARKPTQALSNAAACPASIAGSSWRGKTVPKMGGNVTLECNGPILAEFQLPEQGRAESAITVTREAR